MSLKTHDPAFAFSGEKVSADELGFDYQFVLMNPSIDGTALATAVGTRVTTYALAANVSAIDYPRNLVVKVNNTSGSTNGGTVTINGKDQFGNVIQEVFTVAAATNGGTTIGTKIFQEFTSGSVYFTGAGAASNGCTANVGFGTAGTTTLFGLPFKVGGTSDLKSLSWGSATSEAFVPSASLGSYLDTTQHALKARTDFVGTTMAVARIRSSYVG